MSGEEKYTRNVVEIEFNPDLVEEDFDEAQYEIETYDTIDTLQNITSEIQAYVKYTSIGKNLCLDTILELAELFISK